MLASVYDPNTKEADVYSMGNMDETTTKKIFTNTEREKLEDVDLRAQTSGWISGGDLTATIGQTTFSLTAGTGKIVDN